MKFELLGPKRQAALSDALVEAIETHQPVMFGYTNELRVVEPYALGASGQVRAFQQYPDPGWRLFDLAKMQSVTFDIAPTYVEDDKQLTAAGGIVAQVRR